MSEDLPFFAKVLYDYIPQNVDEVPLTKNSVIKVIDNRDECWWLAESNGVQGLIPFNYVELINSMQAPTWESAIDPETGNTYYFNRLSGGD